MCPSANIKAFLAILELMKTKMSVETGEVLPEDELDEKDEKEGQNESESGELKDSESTGDSTTIDTGASGAPETSESLAAGAGESKAGAPAVALRRRKGTSFDDRMVRRLEAALFLANRLVTFDEISRVTGVTRQTARTLAETLKGEYEQKKGAIEVMVGDEGAVMEAKSEFLENVSELSKRPDLSRKATKILALVAKKGGLLQSELKKYFRGEIYSYTTELKLAGYLESEKRGNTRYLKPSKKFSENFQMV